jgi:hypothetical protein
MCLVKQQVDTAYATGLDEKVAERIEYYMDYGALLLLSVNWGSDLLRKAVHQLTKTSYGQSRMNIVTILSSYDQIKTSIQIDDAVFLKRLNGWRSQAATGVTSANIEAVITNPAFYQASSQIENDLTKHLHEVTIAKLTDIPMATLYAQKDNTSDHWLTVAQSLIKGNVLKNLPDNLTELTKKILKDIAGGGTIPTKGGALDTIIAKCDKRKLVSLIRSFGDDFCNRSPVITARQFLYFSGTFSLIENIKDRDGAVVRNILSTVIADPECLKYISAHPEIFLYIINNADSEADDLKNQIMEMLPANQDDLFIGFAKAVGVNPAA